jgi:UDPglucose--hexose-1-phosphate uridylyltransferase
MQARENQSVPDLRTDILTGRQVIVASSRSGRPNARQQDPDLAASDDPFLEGSENATLGEWLALREPGTSVDQPGWKVRVVPNLYPAAVLNKGNSRETAVRTDTTACDVPNSISGAPRALPPNSLLPSVPVCGIHDVVIECPDGMSRLVELSVTDVFHVLQSWQLRLRQLRQFPDIREVAIFRNEGFSAGASLKHCHSQIIATEFSGQLARARLDRARHHLQQTGRELVQDWLAAELLEGRRVLHSDSHFTVLCPFASRTSWQIRIVPMTPMQILFDDIGDVATRRLAELLRASLQAVEHVVGRFSFNLAVTLPPQHEAPLFRWMIDLLPRTSRIAGWEMLTDVDMITVAPEDAAAQLREPLSGILRNNEFAQSEHSTSNLQWTSGADHRIT